MKIETFVADFKIQNLIGGRTFLQPTTSLEDMPIDIIPAAWSNLKSLTARAVSIGKLGPFLPSHNLAHIIGSARGLERLIISESGFDDLFSQLADLYPGPTDGLGLLYPSPTPGHLKELVLTDYSFGIETSPLEYFLHHQGQTLEGIYFNDVHRKGRDWLVPLSLIEHHCKGLRRFSIKARYGGIDDGRVHFGGLMDRVTGGNLDV